MSRASSTRAQLVISVGIISIHHLCTQGCGIPVKSHTPIYQEAPFAWNLTQPPSQPLNCPPGTVDQPSPAQSNAFPPKDQTLFSRAFLACGCPSVSPPWACWFCAQQSLQRPDLCGFSWWPSGEDEVSFRTAHRTLLSISILDHCLVIGKGRNGTKEATESSGVNAEDQVVEQRQWESRLAWKAFKGSKVVKLPCKLQRAIQWKLLLLSSSWL